MADLARRLAAASDRSALAELLTRHLGERLAPGFVVLYLMQPDGRLAASSGPLPPGLERLSEEVLAQGPLDELLSALEPGLLVPIADRAERLVGILVLGRRADGGGFTEAERRDVEGLAAQAGVTLEIILRAEQLSERMEAERQGDREIGIAREVQRRLLPQRSPRLATLEISARCVQASSVGGDYYDFLDLGDGRVGFVLADVSGKGMAAALRMANLQAHLRSQAASAPRDPLRALRQVNRMLCESTEPEHFATLFLGVYDDATRRMSYINCGHNPPLCLRRGGSVEWLNATATVLGSFEQWDCTLGRTHLAEGDLLVAYSDGLTEAGAGGEQFGERRLVESLQEHSEATPESLVDILMARVQAFADGHPLDDLTLLVARGGKHS